MPIQRAPSSSSFICKWTYDVFLNFRGEDSRTGFTGNLYNALHQKGIDTFIDDEGLRKGEEITPALLKAIEESRIAIIIFSKNYAYSTYCLNELVKILDCIKGRGRWVWPIFYDVSPSDVRHQGGSYGAALAKHEESIKENKDKAQKWRAALSEAANLSGWDLKQGIEYEYHFIGRITEEVSRRINRTPLHIANYPVGLECRVLEVISLLDIEFDKGVNMVGIYGIGGIGKTTIARAVYNLIGDQFEVLCFLANVREVSNKHDLVHLQETLLFDSVGEKNIKLRDLNKGISIIQHRLHGKKVLLVLDDIDKLEQLQALAGRCDWFGCGSRVVITTSDKQLLTSHGVKRIYDVKKLNDEEALQLFTWNAFKSNIVGSCYEGISKRAILYSCGIPLALEVIGSNLFGREIEEWVSALDKYEKIPNKQVLKILKLSYDALEEDEKEIFLDIACFFSGNKLEDVTDMLRCAHGVQPEYAIRVLIDKSLIKIEYDHVNMHDLIQNMGREIVRQQSLKEPGKRSRLWSYEDILHVLQENTGTDDIEAIYLDLPEKKEVSWNIKAFKKMKNLKMLIIRNASFSGGPQHLPNSLRILDWKEYPSKFLPNDFHPPKLVKLDLGSSCIESVRPLIKKYEDLSCLNFSNCQFLRDVPDLSGASNLTELLLDDCPSLIKIHNSVGLLGKLRLLSAERCTKLRTFTNGLKLTSLECLRLSGCSRLQSFPEVLDKMESITELSLPGTAIEELPLSISNLTGLRILNVLGCKHLKQLPANISGLKKLWMVMAKSCRELKCFNKGEGVEQEGMSSIISSKMAFLDFLNCNLTNESLRICLSSFPNVMILDLSFNNFTILPSCIKECNHLRDLYVDHCKQLREIEEMPPKIERFQAKNCTSLTSLHSSILFNQAFCKPGCRTFILPGDRIQEWFENCSLGESVSFWVREEFPAIAVGGVVKVLDNENCSFDLKLSVRINGTSRIFYGSYVLVSALETDHMFLCDLESKIPKGKLQKELLKHQWNHVEVSCLDKLSIRLMGGVIKCTGLHVYRQGCIMEYIRFTKPDTPKRICHDFSDRDNDLDQNFYPLQKRRRTYLDTGVCDRKASVKKKLRNSAFINERETTAYNKGRVSVSLLLFDSGQKIHDPETTDTVCNQVPTGFTTASKYKEKDIMVYNEDREQLSVCPSWQEPSDHVNSDPLSTESTWTADIIGDRGCRTAFKHKEKKLKLCCEGGEWLSMRPCWEEPLDHVNQDSNPMKSTCNYIANQGKDITVYNGGRQWLSVCPSWEGPSDNVNSDSISIESARIVDITCDRGLTVLDHPMKGQPESEVTRFPEIPNIQAPTSTASGERVTGGELHQNTSFHVVPATINESPRNQTELTQDDVEMEAFYASLYSDPSVSSCSQDPPVITKLANSRPSEETQKALKTLDEFLSRDFSVLLDPGEYSTVKATLDYLSNSSEYGGISEEQRLMIIEVSSEFNHWSEDYSKASRKIEFATANLSKADKLEEGLLDNMNRFREVRCCENQLHKQLACLDERKKELEEQINAIIASISASQSEKGIIGKRKREIFEEGKKLKAQRDKLRKQVPCLEDERESAEKIQTDIKAAWLTLGEKFKKSRIL